MPFRAAAPLVFSHVEEPPMSPAKREADATAPAARAPRKAAPVTKSEPAPVVPPPSDPFAGPPRRVVDRPFIWGATAALGVLLVALLAFAVFSLSGIVFS